MGGGPSLPPCLKPGPWASVGPTVEADPPLLPGARGRWGRKAASRHLASSTRALHGCLQASSSPSRAGESPACVRPSWARPCVSAVAPETTNGKSRSTTVPWNGIANFKTNPFPNRQTVRPVIGQGWRKDKANPYGRNALSALPPCPEPPRPAGRRRAGTL